MHAPWKKSLTRNAPLFFAALLLAALTFAIPAVPAVPPQVEGGTVTGKVIARPARFQDETVVYLKGVPGTRPPVTHEMDQKNMKFLPLVIAITAGDTVRFLNNDGVDHNVYSPDGEAFNLGTFKSGDARSHTFEEPGAYRIKCSIHPEMLGYVFVAPSRFAAVIDRKGRFTIKDVPRGTYQLAVWNAALQGPDRAVTVESGKTVEEAITIRL
jgi:plastocyanin